MALRTPSWRSVITRSVLSAALFVCLFAGFEALRGAPLALNSALLIAGLWAAVSMVLERWIYPLIETSFTE